MLSLICGILNKPDSHIENRLVAGRHRGLEWVVEMTEAVKSFKLPVVR